MILHKHNKILLATSTLLQVPVPLTYEVQQD